MLEAIYRKGGVLKYQKAFQGGNESEFKSAKINLFEKHNADVQRGLIKYKGTHMFSGSL